MDYIVTEMTMSRFRRYYEELRPSGHMHYYNVNDRLRSGFPGNRLKYANIPRLEVSFDVDYIAFSFNLIASYWAIPPGVLLLTG